MWTVEFALAVERDLELILDHLFQSYQEFGEHSDVAFGRAESRLQAIQAAVLGLAKTPHQGTLRPDIFDGLRFVRRDGAVFWFIANEDRKAVQVLAIFFGGQDHIRHMLTRLLAEQPG